jgi:hypothetical protein
MSPPSWILSPQNWLKAGVNFNVSSGVRYLGDEGVFRSAYNAVPILPITDDDNYNLIQGSPLDSLNTAVNYSSAKQAGYRSAQNPFLTMDFQEKRQDIKKVQSGVYGEITFISRIKI